MKGCSYYLDFVGILGKYVENIVYRFPKAGGEEFPCGGEE